MRILVHDYSGHPFQVQLSRWLASEGHTVKHLYSADVLTPRGRLCRSKDDPTNLDISPLTLGHQLNKYNLVARFVQEWGYAQQLSRAIAAFKPEAVICANSSPFLLRSALRAARRQKARFITWLQDFYSLAFDGYARVRFGALGGLLTRYVTSLEFGALESSDFVVAIADEFVPVLLAKSIPKERIKVIENWAPLGEIIPYPKHNSWATANGLQDKFVFLYSGTLGLKHDPSLLVDLADAFNQDPLVRVVVISEGAGRGYLNHRKEERDIPNLLLFNYVAPESLSAVLGTADVLITILEPSAGGFSVPSKISSYLCAGKPLLGAIPAENLGSRLILRAGAGLVARPDDRLAFLSSARHLRGDEFARQRYGCAALEYASNAFKMETIGPQFLQLLNGNEDDRIPSNLD